MKNFNNKLIILAVLIIAGPLILLTSSRLNKPVKKTEFQIEKVQKPVEIQSVPEKQMIAITESGFSPNMLKIKTNTAVIWENKSGKAVNVYSDSHPVHISYPLLNFGEIKTDASVERIFKVKGTYKYHNDPEIHKKGTIIVE